MIDNLLRTIAKCDADECHEIGYTQTVIAYECAIGTPIDIFKMTVNSHVNRLIDQGKFQVLPNGKTYCPIHRTH